VLAGAMISASGVAVAQHTTSGGGHASGGHAPAATAHQHFDGRFGHNQYYYDRGYSVRRPPTGGLGEVRGRDGGKKRKSRTR